MKKITHVVFSVTFCTILATVANIALRPVHFVVMAVASLLPNIDHFTRIERSFGRRTVTHSLLGFCVVAILALPLVFFKAGSIYFIVLASIAGHFLIDCVNKEGVCLFYPSLSRAVLPRNENYRIRRGSKAETVLLWVTAAVFLITLPVNQAGLRPALHHLVRTQQSAVTDYLSFSGAGHRVLVEFEGVKRVSQERIRGRWEVIDRLSKTSLVVKDERGRLHTIGNDNQDNIRPITIRAIKDRKQDQYVVSVEFHNESLEKLLSLIPRDGESYISGYAEIDDAIDVLPTDVNSFETIKVSARKVEFSSATLHDLIRAGLQDAYVKEGMVVVRTVIPPGGKPNLMVSRRAVTYKVVSVTVRGIRGPADILIREGDPVKKGTMVAILHEKVDIKVIEVRKATANLAVAKADLYTVKAKTADELKEKRREDSIMGARRTLELLKQERQREIRKGYLKAYAYHLAVVKLKEMMRSYETTSPCHGKVTSVVIDGTNAKIRISANGQ